MCGIFGQISKNKINKKKFSSLVSHSAQRGVDSSGLVYFDGEYRIFRADYHIKKLLKKVKPFGSQAVFGHSRLITNGLSDNQPVIRKGVCLVHNGIVTNVKKAWTEIKLKPNLQIDSEIIAAIADLHISEGGDLSELPERVFSITKGVISCALLVPSLGKILLFSNNGSLYNGQHGTDIFFASESYPLSKIGCKQIKQIKENIEIIEIPHSENQFLIKDFNERTENLIPELLNNNSQEKMLIYNRPKMTRCTKCILPETMPFITFNSSGVCNYCENYQIRNNPKPITELSNLVEPYRRQGNSLDCIIPFSGGRDSCFGLHLVVEKLKMKPVTYTYDWGMVTDLGRRNISRVCAEMGVENIIVAADISKKRKNIKKNLIAWLKSPHLGMIAMLTAGDKHFFRYVETIKRQTGINLNLWGVNPLEQTHFKAGFLGVEPYFSENKVYLNGFSKQLDYHKKRFF